MEQIISCKTHLRQPQLTKEKIEELKAELSTMNVSALHGELMQAKSERTSAELEAKRLKVQAERDAQEANACPGIPSVNQKRPGVGRPTSPVQQQQQAQQPVHERLFQNSPRARSPTKRGGSPKHGGARRSPDPAAFSPSSMPLFEHASEALPRSPNRTGTAASPVRQLRLAAGRSSPRTPTQPSKAGSRRSSPTSSAAGSPGKRTGTQSEKKAGVFRPGGKQVEELRVRKSMLLLPSYQTRPDQTRPDQTRPDHILASVRI